MADTYTWKIAQLDRVIADGGVYSAHWTLNASRDVPVVGSDPPETKTYQASCYGSQGLTPDPTDPSFIPYADVTEADAIGWVEASLGTDAITAMKEGLTKQIDLEITPVDATGVPW